MRSYFSKTFHWFYIVLKTNMVTSHELYGEEKQPENRGDSVQLRPPADEEAVHRLYPHSDKGVSYYPQ